MAVRQVTYNVGVKHRFGRLTTSLALLNTYPRFKAQMLHPYASL